MVKRVFFVDRFIGYSTNMFESLREIISDRDDYEIFFIGPQEKDLPLFSDQYLDGAKKVWSYGHYVRKLFYYIRTHKPDIVHFCFELKTYGPSLKSVIKFPLLLMLIRMTKTKIVLTLHGIFVYKQGTKWNVNYYSSIKIPYFILSLLENIFMKTVCKLSHKIVVSAHIGKLALVEHSGIPQEKIQVIQFGVSSNIKPVNSTKREKLVKFFTGKKVILCFGVISPRKGQESAINAFKTIANNLSDYILVIAGSASKEFKQYEKKLQELSKVLNLENRIIFTGYVDKDEIDILFEIAEIVLYIYGPMSSSTHALTFAIQHTKPVIVTNIETFHEILESTDALFVDSDNETQLANAILKLATDVDLRLALQERMRDVSKKFTWQKAARKHLELYEEFFR